MVFQLHIGNYILIAATWVLARKTQARGCREMVSLLA
jgi:hypothetical protein